MNYRTCLLAITLVAQMSSVPSVSRSEEIEAANQKAFEWLDERGFPNLSKKPFVRVASTRGQSKPRYDFGFLLQANEHSFQLLRFDLNVTTFKRKASHNGIDHQHKFELADFDAYVDRVVQKKPEAPVRYRILGDQVNQGITEFVLARVCATRGRTNAANELCRFAVKKLNQPEKVKQSLIPLLAKDIGNAKTWRAFVAFGDSEITRTELLEMFRDIFRHYPQSQHHERVKKTIVMLKKMIREDEAFSSAPRSVEPNRQQLISNLVFRLRDQNGQQYSQPGSCDIFWSDRLAVKVAETLPEDAGAKPRVSEMSPAWQLRTIGYDAVPQLIAALDDRTFTRSVAYHRNFYFSHHVLRVGDCAERILVEIAGRKFYQRKHSNGAMQKDGGTMTTKAQIEAWWVSVKTKGEKQVLIEGAETGDDHSASQAQRLVKHFPDDALAAIKKGLENTESDWTRTALIQSTAPLTSDGVVELLMHQMTDSPDLMSRVTAAEQLAKRDSGAPTQEMIVQWTSYLSKGNELRELERLIWFFKRSDSPDAIDRVAKDFTKLPVDVRLETISEFGAATTTFGDLEERRPLSVAVTKRIETLLWSALDDTEQRKGMSGSMGGVSYQDPRICDFAAYFLNRRGLATFDLSANTEQRDASLTGLRKQRDSR